MSIDIEQVTTVGNVSYITGPSTPTQRPTQWEHLKQFGYAPGGYTMTCPHCDEQVWDVDKRATCCIKCAQLMYAEQQLAPQANIDESILTQPTYGDIEDACRVLAAQIFHSDIQLGSIVGLTRGGLIPGVMLSHIMELPMEVVSYSSTRGAGDDKCYERADAMVELQHKNILFVDDIADSGHTLNDLITQYSLMGYNVHTATIYYKETSLVTPDFYVYKIPEKAPWIMFPWEVNV